MARDRRDSETFERDRGGIDVHGRSIIACAVDAATEEVTQGRMNPDMVADAAWIKQVSGLVQMVSGAGNAWFGLFR